MTMGNGSEMILACDGNFLVGSEYGDDLNKFFCEDPVMSCPVYGTGFVGMIGGECIAAANECI